MCHRQADLDAYGSAYGLSSLLNEINEGIVIEIIVPEGASALVKWVSGKLDHELRDSISPDSIETYFIVDTGHAALLRGWREQIRQSSANVVVIDHHPLDESIELIADHMIIDESASSTSEIIYSLFRRYKVKPKKDVAMALLVGILFDTQHLRIARERTLGVVVELCKFGVTLDEARELMAMPKDQSETIARLKAARRVRIFRVGRWIVALTIIGSFQASVARSLLRMGPDLFVALGEHEGSVRASFRSTEEFFKQTGIHLGTFAKEVAELGRGVGGGHPTASSLEGGGTEGELQRLIIESLSQKVGEAKELS